MHDSLLSGTWRPSPPLPPSRGAEVNPHNKHRAELTDHPHPPRSTTTATTMSAGSPAAAQPATVDSSQVTAEAGGTPPDSSPGSTPPRPSPAGTPPQPSPGVHCKLCLSEQPPAATHRLDACSCVFCTAVRTNAPGFTAISHPSTHCGGIQGFPEKPQSLAENPPG